MTDNLPIEVLARRNLILDANGTGRSSNVTLCLVRVQGHGSCNGDIGSIVLQLRRNASPKDYTFGIRVALNLSTVAPIVKSSVTILTDATPWVKLSLLGSIVTL